MCIGVVAEVKIKSNCNDDRNYHFLIRCFFIMNEIWKVVKDYPNYEVSNLGRVKSLERKVWVERNNSYSIRKERILKLCVIPNDYLLVRLYNNNKIKQITIHQLMAIVFLNHVPCGNKLVVDHKDENKSNNRLDNLQIITNRENVNRSIKNTTSNYRGVHFDSSNCKYKSLISINGKQIRLGTFHTEEEASLYYENALKAHLNNEEIVVKRKITSSTYKGVCWSKALNKWMASICINGKNKYLGYFTNEIEAYNAYQTVLRDLL